MHYFVDYYLTHHQDLVVGQLLVVQDFVVVVGVKDFDWFVLEWVMKGFDWFVEYHANVTANHQRFVENQ